jgi:hypothetical protein
VNGLATCVAIQVYQLGVLQYENTTNELHALKPDPGYEGFPLSLNSRVSNNDVIVAHFWARRNASPPIILIIKANEVHYFSTLFW